MDNLETLGYISGAMLAICGLPQAIECIKNGHGLGISKLFIWLWGLGEIGTLAYTLAKLGFVGPLVVNYIFNILIISVIMKYVYYPRSR